MTIKPLTQEIFTLLNKGHSESLTSIHPLMMLALRNALICYMGDTLLVSNCQFSEF